MPNSALLPPSLHVGSCVLTHFSKYHVWAEFLEGLTRVKACCNPGACLPEDALGLHQWCCRAGVEGGCLFCWSVFNESDHAERIWPLARRGPVITTSCFPFFHPVHYWTNNLRGEKRMYLLSSFSLVLFPSARLHFAKYRFGGLKITNWQQCEQGCKQARGKRKKKSVKKRLWSVCYGIIIS